MWARPAVLALAHNIYLFMLLLIAAAAAWQRPMLRFTSISSASRIIMSDATFDETSYEADRLSKDAEAMSAMKKAAEAEFASLRTPWKWVIRKRIWDYMEDNDIARQPRPVHHRIPNFEGADVAAMRLSELPEFEKAQCVKVNPDTPQRQVRHLVLERGKTLLTPQPRLRTGFFSTLTISDNLAEGEPVSSLTNSKGVAKFGTPIGLDAKFTCDLVVVGSSAVCPTTGGRVGKGEGFAELVMCCRLAEPSAPCPALLPSLPPALPPALPPPQAALRGPPRWL